MKRNLTSLLLVFSMILSLFTVFVSASEQETVSANEKYASNYLHYRYSYGDDIDDNGSPLTLNNSVNSSHEVRQESNGNNYGYFNFNDNKNNVFFQFSPNQSHTIGTGNLGYMIYEMDFNDFGKMITTSKFFEIHTGTGSFAPTGGRIAATEIINVGNNGTKNYIYFEGTKSDRIYLNKNEWNHIRCELSILSPEANTYGVKIFINNDYFETTYTLGTPGVITYIRVGSTNSTNQAFGLDNITLYSSAKNLESFRDMGAIQGALMMKIGAENASLSGKQIELTNVPLLIDGEVYCPVDIIENATSKTCPASYYVDINGIKYIHLNNIKAAFDIDAQKYEMGLILVGNKEYFPSTGASYSELMDVMKSFVFNIPNAEDLKSIVKENTNNFDHPYILINADRFTELRQIYNGGKNNTLTNNEDKILYSYINEYVNSATSYLSTYCSSSPTGSYSGIKSDKIPVNTNYSKYSNNGYDNGGRTTIPTTPLMYFAFAYQMTGHLNYARAAYDYTLALGEWNHWGPAHFLNCADAAAPVAISYDWLYDAYKELESKGETSYFSKKAYDTTAISTILFTHAIIPGYVQSNNINCPWPGSVESRYSTKTSNWNAVCASGVIAAALVMLEDEISVSGMQFNTQKKISNGVFTDTVTPIESIGNSSIHVGLNTYSDYAAKLTSMNLHTLGKYGLDQYAPDGSYVESPSYWSYGTNSLFRLIASLLSATGDDFGFMDAWGIDTTCYFAIHSESSDYKTWNFNDGGVGMQDSSFFFFVGDYYGDDELIKVRKKHLSSGKHFSIYDILYYDQSILGEPKLSTEYKMTGIDAFSVRSSWDKGAVFAGLMGGPNQVSHGHMDAGSFIYHNEGKIWFHDLGADNYNMGIGYFSNFKLYRIGAEGHNMIAITSEQSTLPYGQSINADPKLIKTENTADGGYAVLDLSSSYGTHVTSAKRGMLFTDSRNTVVIQDEFVFNGTKTAYWFGHYNVAAGYVDEVVISADGRCAFMKSGDDIIRVTIVSDNENFKFEIMDAYTYLLDITHKTDRASMDGASTEANRDSIYKLAIKCENVDRINLAVVIEEVDDYEIGTSYEWTSIDDWKINSKQSLIIDEKFKADFDSSSANIGNYYLDSPTGSYTVEEFSTNSHTYIGISPSSQYCVVSDARLILQLKKNNSIKLSQNKYISVDLDLYTESEFIKGTLFGANITNDDGSSLFVSLFTLSDRVLKVNSSNSTFSDKFCHITAIFDIQNKNIHIFVDGKLISTIDSILLNVSLVDSFEFILPGSSALNKGSSILIDSIDIRTFSNSYVNNQLSSILSAKTSIDNWDDMVSYKKSSHPLAISNGSYLYSTKDIEKAISNGNNIELLRNVNGVVNVSNPVTINTKGYNINYISDKYFPTVSGNTVTFASGKIDVIWHIGNDTYNESYSSSTSATYKGANSKVGAITYKTVSYADGGVGYIFYTTGWSNTPGGSALSANEMIVTESNKEFWLVNNAPLDCMFVTIDSSGKVTPYYSESSFRSVISSSTTPKTIVLCRDIEMLNTTAVSLAKTGKDVYLNGFTLSHRQNDVHMFNYSNGSTGDFKFIGPGTVEADTSRTMFTSSSSTNDQTSRYGIVAENVTLKTNTQIGDLRVGQHRFINCYLYQNNNNGKSFIDLWNKNLSFNGETPVNLLTVSFDGCTIKSEHSSSAVLFSITLTTYAEYYVKDTKIITDGILMRSASDKAKLQVSGSSSIIANKLFADETIEYNNVIFENGVRSSIAIPTSYLPSNAKLTNNYDSALPYRVSTQYASVTWKDINGKTIHTEYAAVGVMPKSTPTPVSEYLKSTNNAYVYDLSEIVSTSSITLTPMIRTSVSVLHSMSIHDDLTITLYISQSEMDTKVQSVRIDGTLITLRSFSLTEMNGSKYYAYEITNITPANGAKEVEVIVEQKDGTNKRYSISAVGYLESLLSISEKDEEKILAVKLLKYIQSAYLYFNKKDVAECERVGKLIDKYQEYDLVFGSMKEEYSDTASMKKTIRSTSWNLSCSAKLRIYLQPSYYGVLNVTINDTTTSYNVTFGKVNGRNYIEVDIPAHLLNESIILSNGTQSVSYGINSYATAMNNSDAVLHNMLVCLSEYSAAAKAYCNSPF